MQKTGRNDLCVCGSGKKFKKCCERKMIGKRFMATKIEPQQNSSNIVSFFKNKIMKINSVEKTSEDYKPIKADVKKNENVQEETLLTK
jgi:hypothetical protein